MFPSVNSDMLFICMYGEEVLALACQRQAVVLCIPLSRQNQQALCSSVAVQWKLCLLRALWSSQCHC